MLSFKSSFILGVPSLNSVMDYISSQLLPDIRPRQITVYNEGGNWEYVLIPSVSKYLFEDIDMVENMAEKGQHNRPGNVYEKRYICVHDTGDPGLGAKRWSEVVRDGKIGKTTYNASFQYVVGNDGYYHMIPDNEIAFHAGDGHTEESIFGVLPSGIFTHEYTKEKPKIEVNEEGYYLINGEKSKIKAPTNEQGEIKKKINDLGIYSELQKVENEENTYEYYLGRTWYNEKYGYISNYGGNLNSIGVESCVNKGSDVYYTWQKLAKLVAKLMDDNNFTIEQVVQHHYFSGKDCPWTKRNSGLWEYFKTVVLAEYQMLQYKKMGFTFEFTSESEYINEKGRIIKPVEEETTLKYKIKVRDSNGSGLEERFTSYIYPQES
jgi:N-acetylmuramoyl-L-alanine amidase CwlA